MRGATIEPEQGLSGRLAVRDSRHGVDEVALLASVQGESEVICDALKRATIWIADAHARPTPDGWSVRLVLCPNVASARAEQQGLRDKSLRFAVSQQSVLDLIDGYVADVNETLPAACRIASCELDLSLEAEPKRASRESMPSPAKAAIGRSGRARLLTSSAPSSAPSRQRAR